jgi:hypothetical protein
LGHGLLRRAYCRRVGFTSISGLPGQEPALPGRADFVAKVVLHWCQPLFGRYMRFDQKVGQPLFDRCIRFFRKAS